MWNPKQLDKLAQQLINALPPGVRELPKDLEKNFRAILESTFAQMNLVTKNEFDAQVRVLRRTREKLNALEKELKDLEKKIK